MYSDKEAEVWGYQVNRCEMSHCVYSPAASRHDLVLVSILVFFAHYIVKTYNIKNNFTGLQSALGISNYKQ